MAWVDYQRIADGCELSGKYGESMRAVEKWQIRVDSPATSKAEIVSGVTEEIGVTWGTSHFELSDLKAMEFSLSPSGRDGMRWILTIVYYAPPAGNNPEAVQESGLPEDVWERAGGTTSVPAFKDKNNDLIVNAAGDPIEGLEREREESSWTLTKCYADDASLDADILACAGKVNNAGWAGGFSLTWKCYFKSAKRVTTTRLDGANDAGTFEYIESHWEFRYDPDTWKSMPWNMGFMELVGSGERAVITDESGRAVKQPVALNDDGTKKDPGDPPEVVNGGDGIELYETADFDATFGEPALI